MARVVACGLVAAFLMAPPHTTSLRAQSRSSAAPAAAFDVTEASIADIEAALAAKRLTCHALVEAYLARIDAYDKQGPDINAIIVTNPNAVTEADALDAKQAEPDFWNRTLQNWQSEFLAVASMAVLSIYLRQRGSPESKPVGSAHSTTGIEG